MTKSPGPLGVDGDEPARSGSAGDSGSVDGRRPWWAPQLRVIDVGTLVSAPSEDDDAAG